MSTDHPTWQSKGPPSGGEGLTCRGMIGSLMDFLDNELSAEEVASVQEHLTLCPSCRNYLESYVQTVRLTKAELRKADETIPELPEELVRHIRSAMDGVG